MVEEKKNQSIGWSTCCQRNCHENLNHKSSHKWRKFIGSNRRYIDAVINKLSHHYWFIQTVCKLNKIIKSQTGLSNKILGRKKICAHGGVKGKTAILFVMNLWFECSTWTGDTWYSSRWQLDTHGFWVQPREKGIKLFAGTAGAKFSLRLQMLDESINGMWL